MSQPDSPQGVLNILCIDNGGARGLSALLLIQEVMERVQRLDGLESIPGPHEYFDLIAGTGTGAVIACMLGRLRMTTHSAIESYTKLVKDVFSEETGNESGHFEIAKLKDALRVIVQNVTGNSEEPMIEQHTHKTRCKTLVFATSTHKPTNSHPTIFQSYSAAGDEGPNCTICEALCATMAYPGLFEPFRIGDPPLAHSFVGGLNCNNPVTYVLDKAEILYPALCVSSILNVGTGHARTIQNPGSDASELHRSLPAAAIVAMKEIATESESVVGTMTMPYKSRDNVYFRLNVSVGLQSVGVDQWELLTTVATHVRVYITLAEINQRIDKAAQAMLARRLALPWTLISRAKVVKGNWLPIIRRYPAPTVAFTGYNKELHQLEACITGPGAVRRVCVVHGFGGAGKTQLVLKGIEKRNNTWKDIVFIDASTRDSIKHSLRDYAITKGCGNTYKDALQWLQSNREPWLIVFDGADDSSLALHNYIPVGNHGTVIITTRLASMITLAQGPGSVCNVGGMGPDDAMTLLLKSSRGQEKGLTPVGAEDAEALLKASTYGFIEDLIDNNNRNLVISHLRSYKQGAFIRQSPNVSIAEYWALFLDQKQRVLQKYNKLPRRTDDYGLSSYTTWVMLYEQLGPQARELLVLIACLHHAGISSDIFRRAAASIGSHNSILPTNLREDSAHERVRRFLSSFLDAGNRWDEPAFMKVVNEITSLSLVEYDYPNRTFKTHAMLHDWAFTMIPREVYLMTACTRALLSASIPLDNGLDAINWRMKLGPHIENALCNHHGVLEANQAQAFAAVYKDIERWDKLGYLQEQMRDANTRTFGEGHPETLTSMSELVETYSKLGRHDEANILQTRISRILTSIRSSKDRDTQDAGEGSEEGPPERRERRSGESEPTQMLTATKPDHGTMMKMGVNDSESWTTGPSEFGGSGRLKDGSDKAGGQDKRDRNPMRPSQEPTKLDLTSQKSRVKRGLNILCIDGGGVRGLSSLLLLQEAMYRLQNLEGKNSPGASLRPADWFDVIAGTGTGGVSACMLGRLGMSIAKAIESYTTLTEVVFSNKKWTGDQMYKAEALKTSLQSIVKGVTGNRDERMIGNSPQSSDCNTLVFAMSKHNMNASIPVMFRSYQARANPAPDCAIWEALYATMAHPDLFKSINITEGPLKYTFVGGEPGSSNPLAHVLTEVRELYPGRHVSCIMSIGAGYARTIRIPDSVYHRSYLVQGIAMKSMATDSERVAEDMEKRFQDTNGVYFRFNVDQGMQDIEADNWERLCDVNAHTRAYLSKNNVHRTLDEAAEAVRERRPALAVDHIDGRAHCALRPIDFKNCPIPTALFTDWAKEIQEIGNCIVDGTKEQQICVIYGLGGAGKSQLAFKVIELNYDSWTHIIYVDATSREMIEDTLRNFAMVKGLGGTYTHALQFLQGTRERWLLVLDNADDPYLDIRDFFPACHHGSILVTTRLVDVRFFARPVKSAYSISRMSPEEASALLLKVVNSRSSRDVGLQTNKHAAEALVQDFGYLALAIVHAGAYIAHSHSMTISGYHALFLKKRRAMLDKYSTLRFKVDDYKKTVYTTWNMCYELLEHHGKAQQLLWLVAFLHCNGITETMFQHATTKIRSHTPTLRPTEIEEAAYVYMQKYLLNFRNAEEDWVDDQFVDIISELTSFSLIEYDETNGAYAINVLVQDWARTVIPGDLEYALERTAALLSISIDEELDDTESCQFKAGLGLHVTTIISEKALHGGINANHAAGFASIFKCTEQWRQEEDLRLKVKAARELELGLEHPATLRSTVDLAHNYRNQGRLDIAECLYNEVLQIRKRVRGEEHDDTQASKKHLASLYQAQGRLEEAEPIWLDVVQTNTLMKGGNNPETLTCMDNLADTYYRLKQLDKAEALRRNILELSPHNHPNKPVCMMKLAEILELKGDWDAAEIQLIRSKEALSMLWGERHQKAIAGRNYYYEFRIRRLSLPPMSINCPSATSMSSRIGVSAVSH